MRDITRPSVCHDSFIFAAWLSMWDKWCLVICATRRIHTCDMTHRHVRHDSFIRATWLVDWCILLCLYVWHDSTRARSAAKLSVRHDSPQSYLCDMTHSCVRHDSFVCATWLIHVCDMSCLYVWHYSTCVTSASKSFVWHDSPQSYRRDMTHICATWLTFVRHGSHLCDMTRLKVICATWLMDMTRLYVGHDSICVTWLNMCDKCHKIICATWLASKL